MSKINNEIIDRYNKNIKMLLKIMQTKLPNDIEVNDINKRLNTALSFDPLFILTESGPYLFKYKKQIEEKNMTFFINKDDWSDDIAAVNNKDDSELSHNIINKIKNIWKYLNDKEKNVIYNITESLLSDYCNHLLNLM
jgi:sulfur relay (sulfurtransferase) DsrC/TusE family protein